MGRFSSGMAPSLLLAALALASLCREVNAVAAATFAGADSSMLQTKQTTGKKLLGAVGAAIGGAVSKVASAVGGAVKALFGGREKEQPASSGPDRPGIFEEEIKDPYATPITEYYLAESPYRVGIANFLQVDMIANAKRPMAGKAAFPVGSMLQTKQTTGKKLLGAVGAAIGGAVSKVASAVGGAVKSLFGGREKEQDSGTAVESPAIFEEDIKDPQSSPLTPYNLNDSPFRIGMRN